MIWWEIDGGALEAPTGGETASSSSSRSVRHMRDESATEGSMSDGALVTTQTRTEQTSQDLLASDSFKKDVNDGTQLQTVERTRQTVAGGIFETIIDDGAGYAEQGYYEFAESTESSFAEHGKTVVNVATDGALHITVKVSRTEWVSWSSSYSKSGATTQTRINSDGATVTDTFSSATAVTTEGSWSTVITASSTESRAAVASWHGQTTTTGTCIHHGTTTATESRVTSCWTVVDDVPTTTTASTTALTTVSTDYSVEATFTTTMTDVIPAGHKRKTVILADCGSHLLVAEGRNSPGFAHAAEWFQDMGNLAILDPLVEVSHTAATHTTTASASETSTASNETTSDNYGKTTSGSTTDESGMAGHTVQDGGVVIYGGGGVYPVGYRAAATALYFPTFGESGPMTLRATGECVLHVTINPGYGHAVSYSTLTATEGEVASWTFRAGADIKVDPCLAYAPDEFAANDFFPFYVAEVACRDAPLRACG